MIRVNVISLLLVLVSFTGIAQSDSTFTKYKNSFQITPLKLICNYYPYIGNPGIALGYERILSNKNSIEFTATFLFDEFFHIYEKSNSQPHLNSQLSIEYKHTKNASKKIRHYTAIQFSYLRKVRDQYGDFYPAELEEYADTSEFKPDFAYYDNYKIDKQTFTLNYKIGFQARFNRFLIDLYAGVGVRFKNIKHKEKEDLNAIEYIYEGSFLKERYDIANKNGTQWTLSLPLNAKIGYRF